MNRPPHSSTTRDTSGSWTPFVINALCLLLLLGLRYSVKTSWQQPTLNLPTPIAYHFSPAGWVASCLMDVVAFLQEFTRYLLS
ncbi:hypothetical protein [Fibrella forsythiae]|uniref:Uncharacterized protein n=1 Tax=Fibrella forsythiae TaxID=2817061 RepID=A0ABS3JSY9_9BACT|nr:hypothetical protein [Fibrella forsythiae]MBO0953142.1 hypothetical protein [Fibrella forsythiae]